MDIVYPEGTSAPLHQVAGHVHGEGKTKLGILQGVGEFSGELLKPGGKRELDFYQHVNYSNHKSDMFPEKFANSADVRLSLKKFLPAYHGCLTLKVGRSTEKYARLDDISRNFIKPSIMDIKIGVENADPLADDEKRLKEKAKFPALPYVKFMLTGMKYVNEDNSYVKVEKKILRSYETEEVGILGLNRFLPRNKMRKVNLLNNFIKALKRIEMLFKVQKNYEFHASSILFTYESADGEAGDETDPMYDVTMIDFAHVFPSQNHDIDVNYLAGVQSLIGYFTQLLTV